MKHSYKILGTMDKQTETDCTAWVIEFAGNLSNEELRAIGFQAQECLGVSFVTLGKEQRLVIGNSTIMSDNKFLNKLCKSIDQSLMQLKMLNVNKEE